MLSLTYGDNYSKIRSDVHEKGVTNDSEWTEWPSGTYIQMLTVAKNCINMAQYQHRVAEFLPFHLFARFVPFV